VAFDGTFVARVIWGTPFENERSGTLLEYTKRVVLYTDFEASDGIGNIDV